VLIARPDAKLRQHDLQLQARIATRYRFSAGTTLGGWMYSQFSSTSAAISS
jgi:hypothetical protein